ncbi:hypothetical protein ACET3Z_008133 [Daucus carota]
MRSPSTMFVMMLSESSAERDPLASTFGQYDQSGHHQWHACGKIQNRSPITMFVIMLTKTSAKWGSSSQDIRATLSVFEVRFLIINVFWALGFVADKDMAQRQETYS